MQMRKKSNIRKIIHENPYNKVAHLVEYLMSKISFILLLSSQITGDRFLYKTQ